MRRIIIVLLCALATCGCGTLKTRPSRQDILERVEEQAEAITSLEGRLTEMRAEAVQTELAVVETTLVDSTLEETILTEVFDTSQPVDTLTLTPPVSSRTTVTRVRRASTSGGRTETAATSSVTAELIDSSERRDSTLATVTASETETHSGRTLSALQRVLIWTGAAAITALLLFGIYKVLKGRSSTIKTLIKKILKL